MAPVTTTGITLHVYGTLAANGNGTQTLPADGRTLSQLLRSLGFDRGSYSLLVINGDLADSQAIPADGDIVDVFPPMCGG